MHRILAVFALVCLCLSLLACGTAKADRESQFPSPFVAKIKGTRGEFAFAAELTVTENTRTIRYTAPGDLAGLSVVETADGVILQRGNAAIATDATGLFDPLAILISPSPLATVHKQNGEQILTYADGCKLILQKDGTPKAVEKADLFYTIVAFTSFS